MIKFIQSGRKLLLLKRVVGLEGDTITWKDGILIRNDKPVKEPYVKLPRRTWNLASLKVPEGYIYVVGDNRSIPQKNHDFGITEKNRIIGYPLW